jgi:hypothetical protein
MSLGISKILLAGANANADGAYFQTGTFNVAANATTVMTAGTYLLTPTANVSVQVNTNSNGNAFTTMIAANVGGVVISDGTNVRLSNSDTGNAKTVTYVTINGGEAAGSTYA